MGEACEERVVGVEMGRGMMVGRPWRKGFGDWQHSKGKGRKG